MSENLNQIYETWQDLKSLLSADEKTKGIIKYITNPGIIDLDNPPKLVELMSVAMRSADYLTRELVNSVAQEDTDVSYVVDDAEINMQLHMLLIRNTHATNAMFRQNFNLFFPEDHIYRMRVLGVQKKADPAVVEAYRKSKNR